MKTQLLSFCFVVVSLLLVSAGSTTSAQISYRDGSGLAGPIFQVAPVYAMGSSYRIAPLPSRAIGGGNWDPRVVVASADEREMIRQTPIELRSNRPLHFYGNTVRRFRRMFSR